ncbi:MAG: hypothetical protein P8R42_19975 [Candidatus Binatia bacterium]|nr:hypothetical protein [Candidatus Binatia bacterium]
MSLADDADRRWFDVQLGEAAIVTEIYLPKKYADSSLVRATLLNSLFPDRILAHFQNASPEVKKRILSVLPGKLSGYDALVGSLERSKRRFTGFSVYDVEGTFSHEIDESTGQPGAIFDDSSRCIRIIDRPEFVQFLDLPEDRFVDDEESREQFQSVVRLYLFSGQRADRLKAQVESLPDVDTPIGLSLLDALGQWADQGSFVLYGFIGYWLGVAAQEEKEIWMTSQPTVINRFTEGSRGR